MSELGDKLMEMRKAREEAGEEFLSGDEIIPYKDGWLDEYRELIALRQRVAELDGESHAWEATANYHYEEARALERRLAAAEALLRETRTRTQNLLNRQHGDAIIMNPDEYLRATLLLLDAALADQPNGHS